MESSLVTSWNTSSVRRFTLFVFTNTEFGRVCVGICVRKKEKMVQECSGLVAANCLTSDPQIRKVNLCAAVIASVSETCQGDACWPACHHVGLLSAE